MYYLKPSKPIPENKPITLEKLPKDESDEKPIEESIEEPNQYNEIESDNKSPKDNYYILDTTEILIKSEEEFELENIKQLQPCIFKIVDEYTPYLLYLLEYDTINKQYSWVKPVFQEIDENDRLLQTFFKAYPFLAEGIDETIGTIEDDRLKGFYKNETGTTIVYDTTTFKKNLLEENPENFIWATIYEILGSQKIYGIPIDPVIISHFTEIYEKYGYDFYTLKNSASDYIHSPYTLYLCQKGSNGTYENIKSDKESDILLYPRIDHEKLDRVFLFSSELLKEESLVEKVKVKRFAVFIENDPEIPILYIDGPESENKEKLDHLYDGTLEDNYQIVTFIENEKQFWSIRNPRFFIPIE